MRAIHSKETSEEYFKRTKGADFYPFWFEGTGDMGRNQEINK